MTDDIKRLIDNTITSINRFKQDGNYSTALRIGTEVLSSVQKKQTTNHDILSYLTPLEQEILICRSHNILKSLRIANASLKNTDPPLIIKMIEESINGIKTSPLYNNREVIHIVEELQQMIKKNTKGGNNTPTNTVRTTPYTAPMPTPMPMPMPMPIGYDMSNMRQQDSQPIVIKHYIDKNNIKQNTSQAPYVLVQQIFKCDGDNTPVEEPVYNNKTTPRRTTTTPRRTTTTPRRTTTTRRRTTTPTTTTTTTTTTPTTTTPTTTTTPNVEELDTLALDALTRFSRTDNNLEQWIQNVKILVNTTRTLVNRYKAAKNYEHAGIVIQNALSQITQNNPELFNAGLVRIEPQMNELSEMALDIMQKIDQA